ncbi:hypothetical protein [Corynebacterium pseudodiphtheriticum]|uniref:hypothetical protein n=1 Tax=Corynebacterium pseudodiphtheriticum TaxID=37637 RepID=UPI00234C7290|nr:hypothetical protein [Corynebacterium pseudodiphtheriticum]MDC7087806.1 hypothetical protein [Corynebacterium pseudodiphtheriticum]MDK4321729.1 hypothetical protein [Corynebacterium pseudodiphtheriticum]
MGTQRNRPIRAQRTGRFSYVLVAMEDPIADNPVAREPCCPGNMQPVTMPPGIVARGNHAAGNGDFGVDYGPVLQIVNKKGRF